MEVTATEITVNDVVYVPKGTERAPSQSLDGLEYKLIRGDRSGVFAGYIKSVSEDGKRVEMVQVRRIWYWAGAASLSQLAEEGTTQPSDCKFPCEAKRIIITDCIESLDISRTAREDIQAVQVWEQ